MRRIVLTLLAVVAVVLVGRAQAKPNFSGTWVQVAPSDGSGEEIVVKHDATTLVQQHASEGGGDVLKFVLDGAQHANTLISSEHSIVGNHKATWDGAKLVIDETTDYPDSGFHRVARQTWWMDEKGQLSIAVSTNLPDGSQFKGTSVYRKK